MIIRWLLKWIKKYRTKYWPSSAKRILRGFARIGAWIVEMVIYALALAGVACYLLLLAGISVLIICSKPKRKGDR